MAKADIAYGLAQFARGPVQDNTAMHVMRLSLLDWAAVGLTGAHEPVAQILRAQAFEESGAPQASLLGSDTQVPARMAALVNGTTSHALDYDDTHFAHIGHPSVVVISAVLAAGELVNASGRALQEAALIGAEASIRIGKWLGRDHYQVGFHQTGTAGAFGAAIGAGRILGLSKLQIMHAIGLVATRASGVKAQFGTMGKPMNAGIAAANGIEAALLAKKGFVSAPEALDGLNGFGPTHHGAGDTTAFEDLGESWLFPAVQHKFHACCHGLHPALEAMSKRTMHADQIEKVNIATHSRWMTVCNIATPQTGLEAKFSYRMVTALALAGHDTAKLESYSDALCNDVKIAALCDRVEVVEDPALSEMQAKLVLSGSQGTETLFHDLNADPGIEMREARIKAKAASLLGPEKANAIWTLVAEDGSARELATALRNSTA